MFGSELRCKVCNQYKPDRCICNGESTGKPFSKDDVSYTITTGHFSSGVNANSPLSLVGGASGTGMLTDKITPTQDPKYVIIKNRLCNASTLQPIPEDEPIMIFRAKDVMAVSTIGHYAGRLLDIRASVDHIEAVNQRLQAFINFADTHPEQMKVPDTN